MLFIVGCAWVERMVAIVVGKVSVSDILRRSDNCPNHSPTPQFIQLTESSEINSLIFGTIAKPRHTPTSLQKTVKKLCYSLERNGADLAFSKNVDMSLEAC